jgi:hypothetical protein
MRLFSKKEFALGLIWLVATQLTAEEAPAPDPLSSGGIVAEVISVSETPHIYDYRKVAYELSLAYGGVQEANNFDTDTFDLGVGFPAGGLGMGRISLRRSWVKGTKSSDMLGRTPFRQEAQMTRYEIAGAYNIVLLEGRSMTRISPLLPDFEQILYGVGGVHYGLPTKSLAPRLNDPPEALGGQKPVKATIVVELGLRWAVHIPQMFGLYTEALYQRALRGGGEDLSSWSYFAGGLTWAIGASP